MEALSGLDASFLYLETAKKPMHLISRPSKLPRLILSSVQSALKAGYLNQIQDIRLPTLFPLVWPQWQAGHLHPNHLKIHISER